MNRAQQLDKWLQKVLCAADFRRQPLAGDASFRSYWRVTVGGLSYVVMDAPPPESTQLFTNIAGILSNQGLIVPAILAADEEKGFLLLTDLGDRVYLHELNHQTADTLYQDAFQAMLKLQQCTGDLPHFDQDFVQRQCGIFEEWYVKKHHGVEITHPIREALIPIYQQLFAVIQEQPRVFVHRDYHSRNLMILDENNPGILDFQDAMMGPITYDLVSLLQDCYIAWPRSQVEKWVAYFQSAATKAGLLNREQSQSGFLKWFDFTGLQRHLKNLGIFARLHHRDNKSGYLKDIPQVQRYICETCERYPELQPLRFFLDTLQEKSCAR